MCSRSDWLDITHSNTKIKGGGITVSNRIFNNGGSKSLRSKKRIEELLNSYKNSKVKRTFEVRNSTPYMFILHTGVTSSRIHFANIHESVEHSVSLKRLMTICRKTDMLLTSFSDDFLFIRSINIKSNNFNQTGYNNIQITVRLSAVNNNNKICDINESQPKISSKKVNRKKSSVLNSEIVDLNDSDILVVDEYCGSCGESFGKNRLSLKRKHKCVSDVLEKHLKIEALDEKKTLENSQETEKTLENINTTAHSNNTKEVGLSPIVFPSSPISKSNNNLTLPINSTMLCIAQTSTPVRNHDVACNTSDASLFSSHNSTNSLIDSPRMKKILEFLDKRYKHKVNAVHNNTICLNSSKPNLETINEEGDKNNDDGTKDKVNNNNYNNNNKNHNNNNNNVNNHVVAINEAGCSAEDCDNFEPQCVDNSNINHIFGDNYYGSKSCLRNELRLIVIDGSNIAMGHSKGKFFSSEGLRLCIDYFHRRGHQVKAFVPNFRLKYGQSSNPKLLRWLYKRGWVVFTPSREVNGKLIVSYDDRFIVQCAALYNAVIVSNDCYRDLISENPSWKETIENNLLMPTWVDNVIYFPSDPLGRRGPTLQKFLRYS